MPSTGAFVVLVRSDLVDYYLIVFFIIPGAVTAFKYDVAGLGYDLTSLVCGMCSGPGGTVAIMALLPMIKKSLPDHRLPDAGQDSSQ